MGKLEASVEKFLHDSVVDLGGYTYKWTSPQHNSVPDRIVMVWGLVWFIEVKPLGKKPTQGQYREIKRIQDRGLRAGWVQGFLGVDRFLSSIHKNPDLKSFDGIK